MKQRNISKRTNLSKTKLIFLFCTCVLSAVDTAIAPADISVHLSAFRIKWFTKYIFSHVGAMEASEKIVVV